MKKMLKDLKNGEWFTLKPIEEPTEHQVFIKDGYVREEKKYECHYWDDINHFRYLKGTTEVYTDFIF